MEAGEVGPRLDAKATVEAPVVYGDNMEEEEEEEEDDNGEEAEFRGVARVWGSCWCFWVGMAGWEITSTLFLDRANDRRRPGGLGDGAGDG